MCAGSDRRAGGARGVHHAAAAGAELLAAALPRPLPQEVAALPPAQPRHQGAHHRGRQPAQPQPGRQAAPSLPSNRYYNLEAASLYSVFICKSYSYSIPPVFAATTPTSAVRASPAPGATFVRPAPVTPQLGGRPTFIRPALPTRPVQINTATRYKVRKCLVIRVYFCSCSPQY